MNLVVTGINLESGSKVLLNAPDTYTEEELMLMKNQLSSYFPGVEFVIMQGLEVVGVYKEMPAVFELES